MLKYLFIVLFLHFTSGLQSQTEPRDVVYTFFEAIKTVDTIYLNEVLTDQAMLTTSYVAKDKSMISSMSKRDFVKSIAKSKVGDLREEISNLQVSIHGRLATLSMDYTFYYKGNLSHCGVNSFTIMKDNKQWKIISIADSRRNENCTVDIEINAINEMIDKWHLGATTADSTVYFDLMTANSIYVGTDAAEVWSKKQFLQFAAPYFAKGKAWAFTKIERNVYSQDYKDIAWFDEVLDTWMGTCRGSGVVMRAADGKWKIQHYVLSVAVANDDIQEYLQIIDEDKK